MIQPTSIKLGPNVAFAAPDGTIAPETMGPDFWSRRVLEFGDGQLITRMTTSENWQSWEMHPNGDEFITQVSGEMELILEGYDDPVRLSPGSFVVVPKGCWHSANVIIPGDAIYVTNGRGTRHRERCRA